MPSWAEHQEFEAGWWADCTNTFGEEAKQITYAHRMGLVNVPVDGHWPVYDLEGKSVLDLGGGPASILLKTINGGRRVVVDPCEYPDWTTDRYTAAGIDVVRMPAEEFKHNPWVTFDECWIYNVLQHVQDPEQVIRVARSCSPVLRLYEWVNIDPHLGHPHRLTAALLDEWITGGRGRPGTLEVMNENGCVGGTAYYGSWDIG